MFTAIQRFRVEWAHCDPAGIIFNPNYYLWMDAGTHALIQAAGFDLIGNTHADPLFRGCPLVASNMDFMRPLYFGDVTALTSRVEKFSATPRSLSATRSARATIHNRSPPARKSGCGAIPTDEPSKLIAVKVPQDVRDLLSVENTVEVTV